MFADQTLRAIVRASIGGDTARVRLSNAFGGDAVRIGAAHVALRARGPDVEPGTDRALTFGGRSSVSIPPGACAVSDPVHLGVPALGELAVSVYLPRATRATTVHASGTNTHFVLAGDRAGAERPAPAFTSRDLHFVAGVEVLAAPEVGLVVCLGDSITAGVGTTPDAHRAWPDLLAARLGAGRRGGRTFALVNQGYAGNRLLHDRRASSALARLDRDVIAQPGATHVIVSEGINDLGAPGFGRPDEDPTPEDLVAGYRRLITRAHDAGLRALGATLTPFGGVPGFGPEAEAKRQAVNDFIRRGGAFDGVLDFDAAVRDRVDPARLQPRHDSGDHVHPGDAGHEALASAIDLRLLS